MMAHRNSTPPQRDRPTSPDHVLGQDSVSLRDIAEIYPSPENDKLYKPISMDAPDIRALAKSMGKNGVLEPIVVTSDGYILSGHRRFCAAKLAGFDEVPVRISPISHANDREEFLQLLAEYNKHRVKTNAEKIREAVVATDPDRAHAALRQHRERESQIKADPIEISGKSRRSSISKFKRPFLDAVAKIIAERRRYWPLSARQIHYALLNDPPLKHISKPLSRYDNTPQSYKSLIQLLTPARLDGWIPMAAIEDETRPVSLWNVYSDIQPFVSKVLDGLFRNYWRDLMQSQPNHIEILAEKNTVASILKPVASSYCIPISISRGFCSLPPRYHMAQRYKQSGKNKFILLVVTDFDPEGEEIVQAAARSMRDDFDISNLHLSKVALTDDQAIDHDLPPMLKAKTSSVNYKKFVDKHGDDVFELEALPPDALQELLREAIRGVIDIDAYNQELAKERLESQSLEARRQGVRDYLLECGF